MQEFQDTFETYKRSFISAFSIFMTVPLNISINISAVTERGGTKRGDTPQK